MNDSHKKKLYFIASLSFVAGIVNSIGFICFGMFVSHISGHATFSAVGFSQKYYSLAVTSFLSIFFFSFGAIICTLLLNGLIFHKLSRRLLLPILLEIFLLTYLFFSYVNLTNLSVFNSKSHTSSVFILSVAMGIQNALLRTSQFSALRTTHLTGTATDFGIAVGDALLWFIKLLRFYFKVPPKKRSLKSLTKMILFVPLYILRYARRGSLFFHLVAFFFFIFGAYLGAFCYFKIKMFILLLPISFLISLVFFLLLRKDKKYSRF
ncbi:MAG: DUF1275 domain-containing protein [Silvanigrellaceae bacterium]|nr:DUF1275 domain-containing protein [Silvanigrellaceae bacterium]